MKIKVGGIGRTLFLTQRGIWTLCAVFVATLAICALVGTEPVRASGACTQQQCTQAYGIANAICSHHGGFFEPFPFECPVLGEEDDGYESGLRDCGGFTPS